MSKYWNGAYRRSVLKRLLLVATCIVMPVVAWAQWGTSSNDIYNSNSGNVGIGTSTPSVKLDVIGFIGAAGTNPGVAIHGTGWPLLRITNDSAGTDSKTSDIVDHGGTITFRTVNDAFSAASEYMVVVRNTNAYSIKNVSFPNGNIGIATTAPVAKLDVRGSSASNTYTVADGSEDVRVLSSNNRPLDGGVITIGGMWGPTAYIKSAAINGEAGDLILGNRRGPYDTTLQPGIVLNTAGYVGIGTTSPTAALDVVGDVVISGNVSAKYQDLAEWVSTAHDLPAGTVVALDAESDNGVVPSFAPYDTHVAGVVSDTPGIILGQAGPGKLKIATTGRVKVHVDTSNGPIHRGDLLVTGTKEGTAMRSEPIDIAGIKIHRPGTLIGKALEPLSEGEGEILVLLSLQ